jgi:putative heme degradation protein
LGERIYAEPHQITLILRRLNLTEANYVHIIEPQWNPQVEEQAIGRALRLGQSREVTVIRYVMENTVEKVLGNFIILFYLLTEY